MPINFVYSNDFYIDNWAVVALINSGRCNWVEVSFSSSNSFVSSTTASPDLTSSLYSSRPQVTLRTLYPGNSADTRSSYFRHATRATTFNLNLIYARISSRRFTSQQSLTLSPLFIGASIVQFHLSVQQSHHFILYLKHSS